MWLSWKFKNKPMSLNKLINKPLLFGSFINNEEIYNMLKTVQMWSWFIEISILCWTKFICTAVKRKHRPYHQFWTISFVSCKSSQGVHLCSVCPSPRDLLNRPSTPVKGRTIISGPFPGLGRFSPPQIWKTYCSDRKTYRVPSDWCGKKKEVIRYSLTEQLDKKKKTLHARIDQWLGAILTGRSVALQKQ